MNNSDSIPGEIQSEFSRTSEMIMSFIEWMHFCILDTARDVNFHNNHLLSFLSQDILETLMGVLVHVKRGNPHPSNTRKPVSLGAVYKACLYSAKELLNDY